MKKHLILILFLVITVPLIALGLIGYQVLEDEQGIIQNQYNKAFMERLQNISGGVAAEMEDIRSSLNKDLSLPDIMNTEYASDIPFVSNVIVLDAQNRRTYPYGPTSKSVFDMTSIAVSDIKMMLENRQELAMQKYLRTQSGHMASYDGWYVFFQNGQKELLFWHEDENNNLIIAILDTSAIIKHLVPILPTLSIELSNERIILKDGHEKLVHQWGQLDHIKMDKPQASMSFSFPLSEYSLHFYTDMTPDFSRSLKFQLLLQLGALALILFFLVVYIYDAMREANKKVSFVNQVSHELKTPLTNIRMYAELLEQSVVDGASGESRKLQVILYECQRLSRLINNVLTLSHKNTMKPKVEKNDVDELIRNVVEGFRPSLEQKHIQTELDLHAGSFTFDRDGVEQTLINLVSNVEKYGAEGCFLGIKSWQEKGRLFIRVWDKGPGIPLKMKERVFKPFYRLQNSVTEGVSGAGIGLALARDLIRRNGGDLKLVENKTGACFEVVI